MKGQEAIDTIKEQSQKIPKIAKEIFINGVKSTISSFEKGPFQVEDIFLMLL